MKTNATLTLVVVAIAGSVLVAETQTDQREHLPNTRYGTRSFYANGVGYDAYLFRSNIVSSPTWSPSQPLPLRPDHAVEIARKELQKLVPDSAAWKLTGFEINSLAATSPSLENAWYYNVHFEPTPSGGGHRIRQEPVRHIENAIICVDFTGKAGVVSKITN